MDRLFQIAQRGLVEELHQLLVEQPSILHEVSLLCSENPLHYSCAAGHVDFTKAILELKPEFAGELRADGYNPLHLASANGKIEIVKEIIKVDPKICRLRGKEGKTPLHLAVQKGRIDVICEMLSNCEGCLEDVTLQKESALHLAVKSLQFGSFQILLDHIRRHNMVQTLNRKDEHGNTVFHLAVWKKQRQILELLIGTYPGTVEVNAINSSGLTALDLLLIFPSEAGDREMQEMLQAAGALKAQDISVDTTQSSRTHDTPILNSHSRNLVEYFKFHEGRDSPSDVRSTLLVIAVLVATATYQVGLSPPGGVWQDDQGHIAGTSIMATHNVLAYTLLVSFNSIGFNVSVYMIGILTKRNPLLIELRILLVSLYITYNFSVGVISPDSAQPFINIFTPVLSVLVPFVGVMVREYGVHRRLLAMVRRER